MKCDLWLAANWTLVHGQCLHPVCSLNGSDALDGSRDVHYGWFAVSLEVKAQMGCTHPSHSPSLFGPSGKELTKPMTSAQPHIMSLSVSLFGLSSPLDSINWGLRQLSGMVLEANTKKWGIGFPIFLLLLSLSFFPTCTLPPPPHHFKGSSL